MTTLKGFGNNKCCKCGIRHVPGPCPGDEGPGPFDALLRCDCFDNHKNADVNEASCACCISGHKGNWIGYCHPPTPTHERTPREKARGLLAAAEEMRQSSAITYPSRSAAQGMRNTLADAYAAHAQDMLLFQAAVDHASDVECEKDMQITALKQRVEELEDAQSRLLKGVLASQRKESRAKS